MFHLSVDHAHAARPSREPAVAASAAPAAPSKGWQLVLYVLLVVAVASGLRVVGIDTWSLWEDEEGSLTRAHEDLFKGFQKYFPIFFYVLKQYVGVVGLSVGALRALPAATGVLSIAFVMIGFRRQLTPTTALVAGLLLAVNFGHLFFSQSIRYYTMVLAFEVLSVAWFFDGFERGKAHQLVLSLVSLVLAMLTHFSALLLGPVFVGYLMLTAWRGDRGGGYKPRWYLIYGVALAAVGAVFAWRMVLLRNEMIGDWAIDNQRDPVHVGSTILAYFGLPVIGLSVLSPWLARELPRRTLLFFAVLGAVPVLELLTLAAMNFVNVTWYYGFIALVGFAVLAAACLTSLWNRNRRGAATILGLLAIGYHASFLGLYYTTAYGDRPRWAEAAAYLRDECGVRPGSTTPPVFGNVPGPVAFHLGEHPSAFEPSRSIVRMPDDPTTLPIGSIIVVEERELSLEYRAWFGAHCERLAHFEAHSGPADRSVSVYRVRRND